MVDWQTEIQEFTEAMGELGTLLWVEAKEFANDIGKETETWWIDFRSEIDSWWVAPSTDDASETAVDDALEWEEQLAQWEEKFAAFLFEVLHLPLDWQERNGDTATGDESTPAETINNDFELLSPTIWFVTDEELDLQYGHKKTPSESFHPVCIGCQFYSGTSYGGNLLICGMHPYGWDGGNTCPDWEAELAATDD